MTKGKIIAVVSATVAVAVAVGAVVISFGRRSLSRLAPVAAYGAEAFVGIGNNSNNSTTSVSLLTSKQNYQHNQRQLKQKAWAESRELRDRLIFDQGDEGSVDRYTAAGLVCGNDVDMADNGCGTIAIYNARILNGEFTSIIDIIYWMEQNDGLVLGGTLGINPLAIRKYFEVEQIKHIYFESLDDMERQKAEGGAYIICQWNNKNSPTEGVHYYAVECRDDRLYSFNWKHNRTPTDTFSQQLCWTRLGGEEVAGQFICGFRVY